MGRAVDVRPKAKGVCKVRDGCSLVSGGWKGGRMLDGGWRQRWSDLADFAECAAALRLIVIGFVVATSSVPSHSPNPFSIFHSQTPNLSTFVTKAQPSHLPGNVNYHRIRMEVSIDKRSTKSHNKAQIYSDLLWLTSRACVCIPGR